MNMSEALRFKIPTVDAYAYESAYFDYINSKIANEEAMASHLSQYIPVNEAAYRKIRAINEAKLGDKIKVAWQRFVNFIKGIFSKFMESVTNILYNEKDYLTKYKDIILNKKPKEIEYSYTGNFDEGINRCIKTTLPVFNWSQHAAACQKDGDGDVVKLIAPDLKYDSGEENLGKQFKEYFFGADDGKVTEGKLSDLHFKDMYNFCYNFDKIDAMVKKDTKYLEQSTNTIMNAIKTNIESNKAPQQNPSDASGSTPSPESESAILYSYGYNVVNEASGGGNPQNGGNNPNDNGNQQPIGKVNIGDEKNTNAVSRMDSYDDRSDVSQDHIDKNKEDAGANNDEKKVEEVCNKWQNVCRAMLTAKCTAVQEIAKTYMKLIRTHVRSYVGNDKDPKDNRNGTEQAKDYNKVQKNNQQPQNDQGNNGGGEGGN